MAASIRLAYARAEENLDLKKTNAGRGSTHDGRRRSRSMQYDENRLARLAATVAAGFAGNSGLLADVADKDKTRAAARNIAKVSVMVARHIMVAAHCAAQKVDELELLYDDADFL